VFDDDYNKSITPDIRQVAGYRIFQRLLRVGVARSWFLGRALGREGDLLDLATLTKLVPPESERSGKLQDVRVDLIIGTEGRSRDFSEGFCPRHRWMAPRWVKIYQLMHDEGIGEPLQLIEYGGYYFVRDGNHRVSVARHTGIEFLTAEVTHYRIPVRLPSYLNRKNTDVFLEKYRLQQRTGLFNIVDEKLFHVHLSRTWKRLEKEVYVNSRNWYIRYHGHEPASDEELIIPWMGFYEITVEHIRQRSLMMLFPGYRETDVFVELIDYWNSYEDPDAYWVGEMYTRFEKEFRRRHFFLSLLQIVKLRFQRLFATTEDQRRFFFLSTRIKDVVPEFRPPLAGKRFFIVCYKQIFRISSRKWGSLQLKQPGLDDIAVHWYANYYKPVVETYRAFLFPIPFEKYYIRFSRKYYSRIMGGQITLDKALGEFSRKIG
jgi:hypothetical protein